MELIILFLALGGIMLMFVGAIHMAISTNVSVYREGAWIMTIGVAGFIAAIGLANYIRPSLP